VAVGVNADVFFDLGSAGVAGEGDGVAREIEGVLLEVGYDFDDGVVINFIFGAVGHN